MRDRQTAPGLHRPAMHPPVLFCALMLAACTDQPAPLCDETARRCLNIETRDVDWRGRQAFQVRLANICHEEIEYKLCFETPGEQADCRQDTLEPTRRTEENILVSRFGGGTRVFVRYVREAKICRFPLTPDVKF